MPLLFVAAFICLFVLGAISNVMTTEFRPVPVPANIPDAKDLQPVLSGPTAAPQITSGRKSLSKSISEDNHRTTDDGSAFHGTVAKQPLAAKHNTGSPFADDTQLHTISADDTKTQQPVAHDAILQHLDTSA